MPDAPLSRQLLELLNALDYSDVCIDYLREHFEFMSQQGPLFGAKRSAGRVAAKTSSTMPGGRPTT